MGIGTTRTSLGVGITSMLSVTVAACRALKRSQISIRCELMHPLPGRGRRTASGHAEQPGQLGEGADFGIRRAGQALAHLAVAVAPDHAHAKGCGGVCVPCV